MSPAPRVPVPVQATIAGWGWVTALLVLLVVIYDGPSHVTFVNPDEATSRHAIAQVVERGRPTVDEPFDDPNDLTHQRLWVTPDGTTFTPAYPATMPLVMGWADRLVPYGGWLVILLPAVGAGSLVAAVALLLPRHHWAAALVPALAFPGTYWLLRPWANISALVATAGIAALLFAVWARSRRWWWGVASLVAAALAAAFRPDEIHVALGLSLLAFAAIARGRALAAWTAGHVVAGAAVAASVAFGNLLTTGAWLTTAVDLLDLPQPRTPWASTLPAPWNHVMRILGQNGLPDGANFVRQSYKYWVELGPVSLLTALAVPLVATTIVVLWRRRERRHATVATLATLLLVSLYVTRISRTDLGAMHDHGALIHSLPRYAALTYVGAAVGVVAGVALLRNRILRWGLLGAAVALAIAAAAYVAEAPNDREEDVAYLLAEHAELEGLPDRVRRDVGDRAVLYSRTYDRYLWSAAPVGMLQHEGYHLVEGRPDAQFVNVAQLPETLERALDAGFDAYLFQVPSAEFDDLRSALRSRDLRLVLRSVAGFDAWEVIRA